MRKLSLAVTAVALVSLAAALVTSRAEASATEDNEVLAQLPLKRLSVELKQVSGENFFRLLSDITETDITTDKCVAESKIDIRMKNAPARWVFASVATQLDLRYTAVDGKIHVECATTK